VWEGSTVDSEETRLAGRNGLVWQMYAVESRLQEDIALALGISQARVSQIIRAVRASIPQQTKDEVVQERIDQLRAVSAAVAARAKETGDKDDIMSLLRIQEREAKLLGLDSAQKVEHSGGVKYEIVGIDPGSLA
jgi:hypothetical protein